MIRVSEVGVRLGGRPILSEVSLDAEAGEVVALIGPNGAGKSTLLGILSGDLIPDQGSVLLGGRPYRQWRTLDLARKRAVLMQDNRVSFGFTVREVVQMGRAPWLRIASAAQDEVAVAEALAAADITGLADRSFQVLSGGERARTCLARILAQDTEVLFLDEPTAALDLRHQEAVLRIARAQANERGRCVVVVLHDLSLAAAYADRVAIIAEGRLAAVGPPREVFEESLLSRIYRTPVRIAEDPDGNLVVTPRRGNG